MTASIHERQQPVKMRDSGITQTMFMSSTILSRLGSTGYGLLSFGLHEQLYGTYRAFKHAEILS